MVLSFSTGARKLRSAWEKHDSRKLVAEYDRETAECLEDLLNVLTAAENLHDIMCFAQYRPHPIDNNSTLSLSLVGRKRLTVRTLGRDGKPTKRLDYSSSYGLILEVSEHYGD